MGVQEELQFLRGKVIRLEEMMSNMNNKIALILNKLVKQQARHISKKKAILQDEENDYLTLLSQLTSCDVNTNVQESHTPKPSTKRRQTMQGRSGNGNHTTKRSKVSRPNYSDETANEAQIVNAHPDLQFDELVFDDSDNVDLDEDESQWSNNHVKLEFASDLTDELEPDNLLNEDYQVGDEYELELPSVPTKTSTEGGNTERPFRRKRNYQMTRTFPNETAAKEFVTSQGIWNVNKTRQTTVGKKIFYQCKISKKCPVYIYLHEFSPGSEVDLYECEDEHVHVGKTRHHQAH